MRHAAWIAAAALSFSLPLGGSFAADWPQYLGPDRMPVSPASGLAREWPADGPRVLWRLPLSEGYSSAVVRDGEVFVLDRIQERTGVLRVLDLETGEQKWTFEYDEPGRMRYRGARNVPAVDETGVFFVGPFGDFICVDRTTRQARWRWNFLTDFDAAMPMWQIAQSPLLCGDWVVVCPQGAKAGVAAFDKRTGDAVWKTRPLAGKAGYVSPQAATLAGVDQILAISASGRGDDPTRGETVGIDAKTGEILWNYDGFQCQTPITPPLPVGEDRIFITGGYDAGSAMLEIARNADGAFAAKELFKTQACGSQTHPPALFEGHLYVNSNDNSRRDGMMCLTLAGEVKWKTALSPNFEKGALLLADGLILNVDGAKGDLRLIEPSPAGYKELAHASLLEPKGAWAPLCLVGEKLILRDQTQLLCLDVKNP